MTRRLLLLACLLTIPVQLRAEIGNARPERGFKLLARAAGAITINRVNCGLNNTGEFCTDSLYSSTIGGAFWPKGTPNQYVFNSGPQIGGIIGPDGGPWAGDTTGAFFFDARGSLQHSLGITDVFNANSAADRDAWPAAAHVPPGLTSPYHPLLQGAISASEGDVWWLMWEGDPSRLVGRHHPLGVVVEVRALGWNYPVGNDDIIYLATTYYNITSLDPADYAGVRPELRPILLDYASRFQASNELEFGVTLPDAGYTIDSFYVALAADPDVADAGNNFASVNVPFSLGFAYDGAFSLPNWTVDPRLNAPPFFVGSGFFGTAFLTDRAGEGDLRVFSVSTNGGPDFPSARNTSELYRFLSGKLEPIDGTCSFNPLTDKICFVRTTSGGDMRTFQSTGPMTLAPGEYRTRMAAYVFAGPVLTGASAVCPSCNITPGSGNIIAGLDDPAIVAGGVNPIDSIAGFLGGTDLSGDGVLQADEFLTAPRSLYGKTQLAQAIFDHQFLLPSAPAAPDFFLIPGNNQVTVIWRPSVTEQTGDPFFDVAKDAQVMNAQGVLVPNPLYDPNFRQFDVEGYRVYRGRVEDPSALTMLISFDYSGTTISDYSGVVNPTRLCAPELAITTDCPIAFDPIQPGLARSAHVNIPLVGEVVQIRAGDRIPLTDGSAFALRTDTTFAYSPSTPNYIYDSGVPFTFVDNTVRNNFRYFYSVAAFDINSVQSGPASSESSRILKSVTPVRPASNYQNTSSLSQAVYGRGVAQTDLTVPALDPSTGTFSKKMPASNGWQLQLISFVQEVIGETDSIVIRLDSMVLGSAYESGCFFGTSGAPNVYYASLMTATDTTSLQIPLTQDCFNAEHSFAFSFTAIVTDAALASRYGGDGSYSLGGQLDVHLEGNYYTAAFGRGCANGAPAFGGGAGCDYNGARWFDGPSPTTNETVAHPNGCSAQNNTANFVTCYNNAGRLTGVTSIFEQKSYQTTPNVWRNVEGVLGGATRGADYNVYWGSGGVVDSVIDVSNNVVVPFDTDLREGASWGILNQSAATLLGSYDQRIELTITDFGCVPPFTTFTAPSLQLGCTPGTTYQLSNTALPGPIVFWSGPTTNARIGCTIGVGGCGAEAPNPGFAMYLPGHLFMFELAGGLPARGTVWSMRDYIGAIRGGGTGCATCTAGSDGSYVFSRQTSTFAAVGAELRLRYDVINQVNPPTRNDLSQVHTVPDPYYLRNSFEADAGQQVIKFVNLPQDAVIRIYSSSGVLVNLIEHHSTTFGGSKDWNVRNRSGRRLASGVYFYHIEAGNARRVGRLTIVNDRPGF